MKFSLISTLLVAGAGLVSANTAAEEPTRNALANVRFGHAMAPEQNIPPPPRVMIISSVQAAPGPGGRMRGCGGRFRSKAIAVANAFRKAFGLEPIEVVPHHMHHPHPPKGAEAHILPFIGAGTPTFANIKMEGAPPHPHFHHSHHSHHRASFHERLNRALLSLGPWEGGAVAFVLGCGIGVLLRMFFVLILVTVRAFKCKRSNADGSEYTRIYLVEQDAEEIFVAPPQYNDEKVEEVAAQV